MEKLFEILNERKYGGQFDNYLKEEDHVSIG